MRRTCGRGSGPSAASSHRLSPPLPSRARDSSSRCVPLLSLSLLPLPLSPSSPSLSFLSLSLLPLTLSSKNTKIDTLFAKPNVCRFYVHNIDNQEKSSYPSLWVIDLFHSYTLSVHYTYIEDFSRELQSFSSGAAVVRECYQAGQRPPRHGGRSSVGHLRVRGVGGQLVSLCPGTGPVGDTQ